MSSHRKCLLRMMRAGIYYILNAYTFAYSFTLSFTLYLLLLPVP